MEGKWVRRGSSHAGEMAALCPRIDVPGYKKQPDVWSRMSSLAWPTPCRAKNDELRT